MVDMTRLPGPVSETWDWQRLGSCRGKDSAIFFHPEAERGLARAERVRRAKEVCMRCPVIVQCRHHALTVQEPYGIWGGLDEGERRAAFARRKQLRKRRLSVA
jgi:WhiB family transcriptional regulator, redox-sensing transcriptional regulator